MSADLEIVVANRQAKELARLEKVTPQWMDDMTTRVFNEIKRQIKEVEESKPETPAERIANARTLASLQHTLGETLRIRRERETFNETEDSKKDANPRGKIARRLDRIAAAKAKAGASAKPE